MGYYSDLHIDLQELNAHLQDHEPDFKEYSKKVMDSDEYAEDMDQGYDEYKEKRAGLFEQMGIKDSEPNLDFLTTRKK
jgi:hypothetical protein